MRSGVWESEANVILAKTNAFEARESYRAWRENRNAAGRNTEATSTSWET